MFKFSLCHSFRCFLRYLRRDLLGYFRRDLLGFYTNDPIADYCEYRQKEPENAQPK